MPRRTGAKPISPFLAVSILAVAVKRNEPISDVIYDEAFDALNTLLEQANDQRYPDQKEEEE